MTDEKQANTFDLKTIVTVASFCIMFIGLIVAGERRATIVESRID